MNTLVLTVKATHPLLDKAKGVPCPRLSATAHRLYRIGKGGMGGDYAWGDENVPYFAVNDLPIFVPRKLSWSLVREHGWVETMAFGAASKLVCARVLRVYTKPNPPFPVPPQCHSLKEATNRRERWWVGLRARLSGRLFQEKLNWRQHPGIDPPYAPEPAREYCRKGEQIPEEKNLPKLDDFHHPSLNLHARFLSLKYSCPIAIIMGTLAKYGVFPIKASSGQSGLQSGGGAWF